MPQSLLSQLAIAGVIASSPSVPVDAPPVPELSPSTAVTSTAPAPVSPQQSIAQAAPAPITKTVVVEAPVENAHVAAGQEPSNIRSAQEKQDQGGNQVDDMQVLSGIDISSHQHNAGSNMNIKEIIAGGQDFGFVKATEGTHYTNPYFRTDVISFINEKAPVGFYHYARPTNSTTDARAQAQRFIKTTGMDIGVKALPPVLDLEESEGLSSTELISWTEAFVDEVKTLTGRDTMIYTYPNFWKNEMGNTNKFSHLPLWIANYNNQGDPGSLPGGWNDWEFWQYSSKGEINGIDSKVDVNVYSKDKKDLDALYMASKDGKVIGSTTSSDAIPAPPTIVEKDSSSTTMGNVEVPETVEGNMNQLRTLLSAFAK